MIASLHDIRIFVAAFEERSFTAAAARVNGTQSGVSQHIRKLEEQHRVELFKRGKGRVELTPAGNAFYQSCLDVLRAHDAATKSLQSFAGGLNGEISVGLMPTMTRFVLAPALARFTSENPNCGLHVIEGYSGTLTKQVQSGELDFAIVPGMAELSGVRVRPYLRTPEVLVASRKFTDRQSLEPVAPAELGRLRLVVPSRANTRRLSIERYFLSNNVGIDRILELDAMFGTLDLISRSDWVAVLPGILMATEDELPQFVINPLTSPKLLLDLVLIEPVRQSISAAASAFLELLFEEGRRLNRHWDHLLEA